MFCATRMFIMVENHMIVCVLLYYIEMQFLDDIFNLCPANCAHDLWSEWKDKLPILFQIDCTTNDCSLFFKDVDQVVDSLYIPLVKKIYPFGH